MKVNPTPASGQPNLLSILRERLVNRPDTEHEAVLIRVAFSVLGSCYLFIALQTGMVSQEDRVHVFTVIALILSYSVTTIVAILIKPGISVTRRVTWIILDNGLVTYALYFLGETAIPFFGIFLFNICGNGFRFGERYLYLASAFTIMCFVFTLLSSEYWVTHRVLGAGLLIMLVVIPIYFASLVRQLHVALAHMRAMANHDTLTGLPNRHSFYEQLQQVLKRAKLRNTSFAVIFIDLDGFKPINDEWGHAAGDAVLRSVARRLEQCVRQNDIVTRFGGDEFVIILPDIARTAVFSAARNIIDTVAKPHELNGKTVALSSSLGISVYPENGQTPDELIAHADAAMYRSKRAGKNCFCLDEELQMVSSLSMRTGECGA